MRFWATSPVELADGVVDALGGLETPAIPGKDGANAAGSGKCQSRRLRIHGEKDVWWLIIK
jgi:hypothetical protein